ncbi:MAG: LPS assembly protein LptD, partial [Xanthomonadales bacterium]|nr:LPS assembly protein LptD [Xanthomonadales bacterium]
MPGASADGSAPTTIDAGHMSSPDSNHFQLRDHVRIQHGSQLLRAEQVDFQRDNGQYLAQGKVRYQDPSLLLRASTMQGTTTPRHASAAQVRYQLRASRGNGRASLVQTLPDQRAHLDAVVYTTCDLADPGWLLRAERIDIDQQSGIARAHDVTLRLGDVPVLWLPYARFPIDDRRQTGFLYPLLGYSSQRGLDITAPYYLNLAPNYDATLYPRVMSKRGFMLGGELRYLRDDSKGEIRYDYLAHDRVSDDSRSLLRARSVTRLAPNWSLNVNLNRVSDARYFEDFGEGLNRSATQLLASSIYVRGRGQWWDAAIGADSYQITDPTLSQIQKPYRRMPRATFNADVPLAGGLSVGVDSEAVSFRRDNSLNGHRLDLYPHIEWALQGPYWHV